MGSPAHAAVARRGMTPPAGRRLVGMRGINPKDLAGQRKVPMGLLPAAGKIYGALAMADGAARYTAFNWRTKKVRMTVYLHAIERHLSALWDGEDLTSDSRVPHEGAIIACASILADSREGGFLVDDRPPKGPASRLLVLHTRKPDRRSRGSSRPPRGHR